MKLVVYTWILLFGLVSLAPDMQGAQYLKAGNIVRHFQKDYSQKGISFGSFLDFLKEHYADKLDLSKEDHKQLPFKSFSPTAGIQMTIHEVNIRQMLVEEIRHIYREKVLFSEPQTQSRDRLFSIWNPPRA